MIILQNSIHARLLSSSSSSSSSFFLFLFFSSLPAGVDHLLHTIYDLYSDYVMKNPFYELEMPIRCELFEQNLQYACSAR